MIRHHALLEEHEKLKQQLRAAKEDAQNQVRQVPCSCLANLA